MGTCYIGVAEGGIEYGECRDSIELLEKRPGDSLHFGRGTKGYEVRQQHFNRFIASEHEWLLMLDGDMVYPRDALEQLRSHGVPYVSGYYLQRRHSPLLPVWFHPGDEWPLRPFLEDPERGRLHPLGASGWGCVLIHRDVIQDTRQKVLRGEWDVIEDEMAMWPYDLTEVMGALAAGDIDTLRELLRPLRGQYDRRPVGSDIRYPFMVRAAGYDLWGDPDVRPGHMLSYALQPSDYAAQGASTYATTMREVYDATDRGRALWTERMDYLAEMDE